MDNPYQAHKQERNWTKRIMHFVAWPLNHCDVYSDNQCVHPPVFHPECLLEHFFVPFRLCLNIPLTNHQQMMISERKANGFKVRQKTNMVEIRISLMQCDAPASKSHCPGHWPGLLLGFKNDGHSRCYGLGVF